MKMLCYNVQACCGGNYLRASPKISGKIAIKISEVNPDIIGLEEVDIGSFRSQNQIKYLAEKLNYNYISACKYGWAASLPALKYQHLAILSRYKILETKQHKFSVGFKRLALEAVMQAGKEKISVIVTHLSLGKRSRAKQIKELLDIISKIRNKVILLGDFNQENLKLPNLISCCTAKTYPSSKPKKQWDYIFISRGKIKSASALPWQLSDHLPIYAELEI